MLVSNEEIVTNRGGPAVVHLSYELATQPTNRVQEMMDSEQLRAQLEMHHASSFGWAMACCGRDRSEAEEVLQIAYWKVLEGKARFEGAASFKTWLFAVIRKTAADQRRNNMLRRLMMLRASERDLIAARSEHPDEAVYRDEVQKIFGRALARLPRRQYEALQLVFYHELSLKEAADVMGISLGSARTHYERGKKRLRQLLQESEEFYGTRWTGKENPAIVQ